MRSTESFVIKTIGYYTLKLATEVIGEEITNVHHRWIVFLREPPATLAFLFTTDVPGVSSWRFFACAIVLPMTIVEDHVRRNNDLAFFFIRSLDNYLGQSDTRTVNLTQKHIRGRLAEALIVLLENYGYETNSTTLNIYLSREDLANLSNMTTSNAIRTLTTFATENLITVDGRKIIIINEEELRRISKYG